jgi:hypothetical protein
LDSIGLGGGHNAVVNLLIDNGILGARMADLAGDDPADRDTAVKNPPALRVDRGTVLSLMLAMIANSVFTQELGAPANVAYTALFIVIGWLKLAHPSSELYRSDRVFPESSSPSP